MTLWRLVPIIERNSQPSPNFASGLPDRPLHCDLTIPETQSLPLLLLDLPPELLLRIFQVAAPHIHLSGTDTAVAISHVSQSWRRLALSESSLWSSFDIDMEADSKDSQQAFLALIERSRRGPISLRFKGRRGYTTWSTAPALLSTVVSTLVSRSGRIQLLDFQELQTVRATRLLEPLLHAGLDFPVLETLSTEIDGFPLDIRAPVLQNINVCAGSLTKATLHQLFVPTLVEVTLSDCAESVGLDGVLHLLHSCPALEVLDLRKWLEPDLSRLSSHAGHWPRLRDLRLPRMPTRLILPLIHDMRASTIRQLAVAPTTDVTDMLPLLFGGVGSITEMSIHHLAIEFTDAAGRWRRLIPPGNMQDTLVPWLATRPDIFAHLARLTTSVIPLCTGSSSLPVLEELRVQSNRARTAVAMPCSCPRLARLSLDSGWDPLRVDWIVDGVRALAPGAAFSTLEIRHHEDAEEEEETSAPWQTSLLHKLAAVLQTTALTVLRTVERSKGGPTTAIFTYNLDFEKMEWTELSTEHRKKQ